MIDHFAITGMTQNYLYNVNLKIKFWGKVKIWKFPFSQGKTVSKSLGKGQNP